MTTGEPTKRESFQAAMARVDKLKLRYRILEHQIRGMEALEHVLKPDWVSDSNLYNAAFELWESLARETLANCQQIYQLSGPGEGGVDAPPF